MPANQSPPDSVERSPFYLTPEKKAEVFRQFRNLVKLGVIKPARFPIADTPDPSEPAAEPADHFRGVQ